MYYLKTSIKHFNFFLSLFLGAASPAFHSSPPPTLLSVGRGPGYLLQSGPLGAYLCVSTALRFQERSERLELPIPTEAQPSVSDQYRP